MPWPTPQEYNEAIQNPNLNIADPELAAGHPETTALGLPRPITGNFASVYRLHCSGKDWAVRCFWREYSDMRERYAAISRHVLAACLPYTVGFEYLPKGIRVRGTWYPILKMEWVEGDLLGEWVERNLTDGAGLAALADRWLAMVCALEGASMAHGDLQHGNVLVVGGQLKLVDYDGMYVPALAGKGSHEVGHQNYQHPRRMGSDFGPLVDRFSAWVIYLSLRALAHDPQLWALASGGDECLLLRKSDFCAPGSSAILNAIRQSGEPAVRSLVERFEAVLGAAPSRVPPLETQATSAPKPSYGSIVPDPVRVAWRTLVPAIPLVIQQPGMSAAIALPGWLHDHVSPLPPSEAFRPPSRTLLSVWMLSLVVLAAASLSFALGLLPATLAGVADGGVVVLGLLAVLAAYHREPAVRRMKVILGHERRCERRLKAIDRQVKRLEKRNSATQAASRRGKRLQQRAARLAAQERGELDLAETMRHGAVDRLDRRARAIDEREASDVERELRERRTADTRAFLRRQSIATAPLPSVGWWMKVRIRAAGVFTADDLDSRRIAALRHIGEEPLLELVAWRVEMERLARRSLPARLPPEDRDRIAARYVRQRDRLEASRTRVDAQTERLVKAIGVHYRQKRLPIERAMASRAAHEEERRIQVERRLAEAADARRRLEGEIAGIRREYLPFRDITLTRFLAHTLVPRA